MSTSLPGGVRGRGWVAGCRGGVLRAGDRQGWREVEQRRELLPDAKARVGGEAEFDLFAPNAGNDDLYRPLGDPRPRWRCSSL